MGLKVIYVLVLMTMSILSKFDVHKLIMFLKIKLNCLDMSSNLKNKFKSIIDNL